MNPDESPNSHFLWDPPPEHMIYGASRFIVPPYGLNDTGLEDLILDEKPAKDTSLDNHLSLEDGPANESHANKRRRTNPTSHLRSVDWEPHKAQLFKFYGEENHTLSETMMLMTKQHGFNAS
jgi:hypothetical protein